jgi:uncharacterized protein (DUF1800 family)
VKPALAIFLTLQIALPAAPAPRQMQQSQRPEHALNRLTWGPRPGDIEAVRKIGVHKWIEQQLHPDRIAENPELERRLAALPTLQKDAGELMEAFRNRKAQASGGARAGIRPIAMELQNARVLRAVYSNRQLEDVLADFWFNHFNVYLDKGADRVLTGVYERDAIRPHVLGKFRDLLGATAEHPAMLFYLDNWQSVSPESFLGKRARGKRARGINENYARELLELHTLGVDGGYTQRDVTEVARCFTGWTIRDGKGDFVPAMHDNGEKTVLGHRIPAGGGRQDGVRVLDIVSRHPSTARFISRKLAQRFVADDPPESLVKTMAAAFTKSDGDLRAVMKAMFGSKEFWSTEAFKTKLKSPFEMVVAAVRSGNPEVRNGLGLAAEIAKMGQPLFRKVEPTGYGNTGDEWQNSASLLARMNFAGSLAANRIPGVTVTWDEDARTVEMKLGSPEFQRR